MRLDVQRAGSALLARGGLYGRDSPDAGDGRARLVFGGAHAHGGDGRPGKGAFEPVGGIIGHEPSAGDDDDLVAQRADLGEDVAAHNDGAVLAEGLHEGSDLDDLERVESDRRLVEDDDARVAQQRLRDADPLPIPLRQVFNQAVLHASDAAFRDGALDGRRPVGRPYPLRLGNEREVFERRHVGVERRLLGKVADPALDEVAIFVDLESVVANLPGGCGEAPCHDVHRRGLACPVRAEQSADRAVLDGKRHVAQRGGAAIAFREVAHFDHRASLSLALRPGVSRRPHEFGVLAGRRPLPRDERAGSPARSAAYGAAPFRCTGAGSDSDSDARCGALRQASRYRWLLSRISRAARGHGTHVVSPPLLQVSIES